MAEPFERTDAIGSDCPRESVPNLCSQADSTEATNKFDFGFLPIPIRLRYNVNRPFHFGLSLNVFFGVASTVTVSNLYFCQPILVRLAESFNVTKEQVALIPALTQAGYATGLLLISPLGDLVRRRQLLLLLGCLIGVFNLGLALSPTDKTFACVSYLIGIVTVVPQIMIPLAADLAPPERRASAISIVISGALLGILFARVVSGILAELTSWRIIYWISCGMQFANALAMWMVVPDYPPKNTGLSYFGILYTMGRYAVTEPTLIQCCLIGMLSSAIFVNFWVNLTFLLTDAPYHFSTLQIGLFGLIGALGVMTAPLVGRFIDKLDGWTTTGISIIIGIVFQSIFTGAAGLHIAAVVIVCFGLDVGSQMSNVSNSNRIYAIAPLARARMNAVFVIALFLGQVMGTSVGTRVYLKYGWRVNGALALGFHGPQLVFLFLRGPKAPRARWVGWRTKPKAPAPMLAPHEPQEQTRRVPTPSKAVENEQV